MRNVHEMGTIVSAQIVTASVHVLHSNVCSDHSLASCWNANASTIESSKDVLGRHRHPTTLSYLIKLMLTTSHFFNIFLLN